MQTAHKKVLITKKKSLLINQLTQEKIINLKYIN